MYSLYRALTVLTTPLLPLLLQWRLRHGKEDAARMGERLGMGHEAKGMSASLLWIHAASMGESASVLPLIDAFLERHPDWQVMVTTVTVTSAKLMAEKLPPQAFHQFAPLDNPAVLRRFFAQWQPQLAFWVESELWPNMTKMTPCPMYLINARMSERSFRRWQKAPALLREMLGCFTAIFPQSEGDAERFRALSAQRVQYLGNLKYDAPLLSCDTAELTRLREMIGNRHTWLAVSTHPGEEEQIATVHEALVPEFPDLLTLIVPRHAPRGDAIAAMLRGRGLSVTQRSKQTSSLLPLTSCLYLADTMGELGLFYRLSDIVFVGGSLVPHGGQNLLEAARLNCAILCGAHMHNFAAVTAQMLAASAVQQVADVHELQQAVAALLRDANARQQMATCAAEAVRQHSGIVDNLLNHLSLWERSANISEQGERAHPHPKSPMSILTSPGGRGVFKTSPAFWQSRGILSTLLLPLSWFYTLAGWLRWQCVTPRKVAVSVICVGNAVAGGAGKTPVAMAVAKIVRDKKPHFISRGYGGAPHTIPLQVQSAHTAADVGDEPLLLARVAPCWVSADRVKSAEAAIAAGAKLLLMDDGLQNPGLHKDIALLVVDGATGFGNGRVMPAGALREPVSAAKDKADAMVVVLPYHLSHRERSKSTQAILGEGSTPPPDSQARRPLPMGEVNKPVFIGQLTPTQPLTRFTTPVAAFAGIGRPEKFFDMLRAGGITLTEVRAFPDHHRYTAADIVALRALGLPLLTTAKDAVKLPEDFRREVEIVEVEFQFDDAEGFAAWLISKLS